MERQACHIARSTGTGGRERERKRKKLAGGERDNEEPKRPLLLPPSTLSFLFLPPHQSLGRQLECQMVDGNSRQARGQLQGRPRSGAGSRRNGVTPL